MLLLAIVLRRCLRTRRGVVGVLAAALVAFVFLIAVLSYFHQASMGWVRICLVCARYAAVGEITILKVVYLLLLDVVGLGASSTAIHQIHVVSLVLLQLALLLLLNLNGLMHLINDSYRYFFIGTRMCVEKLVRLLGAEK